MILGIMGTGGRSQFCSDNGLSESSDKDPGDLDEVSEEHISKNSKAEYPKGPPAAMH